MNREARDAYMEGVRSVMAYFAENVGDTCVKIELTNSDFGTIEWNLPFEIPVQMEAVIGDLLSTFCKLIIGGMFEFVMIEQVNTFVYVNEAMGSIVEQRRRELKGGDNFLKVLRDNYATNATSKEARDKVEFLDKLLEREKAEQND